MNREYYHLLQPYAKQFGVKMCLENMFGEDQRRGCLVPDMFSDPHEYAQFFDELNDPDNFTCCIDTATPGSPGRTAATPSG